MQYIFRYDNHREQILRGGHTEYEDNCLDVYQYFTASCYKGFGDDPDGFFKVYGTVFDTIAAEDIEFMETEKDFEEIPKFGSSLSDYEEVVGPFYAYWQSYCTKKSYAWLSNYNINEIRDRRILREIEKENKKLQQKARKDRNEEIRALVAFVRKRDKRVLEHKRLLEERATANRLKQEQKRIQQIQERRKELEEQKRKTHNSASHNAYEAQLKELENAYASSGEDFDDDDSGNELENGAQGISLDDETITDYYLDDLYCVACNKSFKNASSFSNHESSKKHKDNIEKLKREMQLEENGITEDDENDEDDPSAIVNNEVIISSDENSEIPLANSKLKKKGNKSKRKQQVKVIELDDDNEVDAASNSVNLLDISIHESDKDDWDNNDKRNKKMKNKKIQKPKQSSMTTPSSDTAPSNKLSDENTKAPVKLSKKSQKLEMPEVTPGLDVNHVCVSCKGVFESKNKLFQHLKKTGHGVYIPELHASASKSTDSGKGKRKK